MAFLLDTSILIRLANRSDPSYAVADHAVVELHHRGEMLHLTAQNLVEFLARFGPGITVAHPARV